MKALNLKEFKLFTDISRAGHIVVDARKEFANAIYMGMNGIVAHDLAFRILHSEGGIEVSEENRLSSIPQRCARQYSMTESCPLSKKNKRSKGI